MILDNPAHRLGELPASPGVYRFFDANGSLLYIGKAKDLSQRVRAYFEGREHGPHIKKMAQQIRQLEIIATATELEALLLEQRLIHQHKPKYNIIFRDDKTYSYISLTRHRHPQIKTYRGKRAADQDLFGPYVDSRSAKARVELVQKVFLIRTCDDSTYANRSRPCVLHQIGRCSGPCVPGLVADADYGAQTDRARKYLQGKDATLIASMTKEMERASEAMAFEEAGALRDQIRQLSTAATLHHAESGDGADFDAIGMAVGAASAAAHVYEIRSGIIHDIYAYSLPKPLAASDTLEALLSQHYLDRQPPDLLVVEEIAAAGPDMLAFLHSRWGARLKMRPPETLPEISWHAQARANANQSIANIDTPEQRHAIQEAKLLELFPKMPVADLSRVECFDISHFQGEGAVASCVVYEAHAMRPAQYRLFNIAAENAGDDFASMKEALIRRYQNAALEDLPKLVVVDGGAGQMAKAREALELIGLDIPMIGIAKGVTRKLGNEELICSWGEEPRRLDKAHPALLLLSLIRDESHRFAITRNRKKIGKKRVESRLAEIPGVGPSKRKALLLAFGSAARVGEASMEQLAAAPGIGPSLAAAIKRHFDLDGPPPPGPKRKGLGTTTPNSDSPNPLGDPAQNTP